MPKMKANAMKAMIIPKINPIILPMIPKPKNGKKNGL